MDTDWSDSRWGIIISNLIDLEKQDWSPKICCMKYFQTAEWNLNLWLTVLTYSITVYKLNIFNSTNTLATSIICKFNQDLGQLRAYVCLCVRVSARDKYRLAPWSWFTCQKNSLGRRSDIIADGDVDHVISPINQLSRRRLTAIVGNMF